MKIEHYNQDFKIEDDAYIWRYMSIDKVRTLLLNNQLYFTRIDCFDDPLEGLHPDIIFALRMRNDYRYLKTDDLKSILKNPKFIVSKNEMDKWQKSCFVSCWYMTEALNHNESFSQWLLYKSNFAIKINFSAFLKVISHAIADFRDEEINSAKYGKIEYLNLYNQIGKNATIRNPYLPSFIKDYSYIHEREPRFSLYRDTGDIDRKGIKIHLQTELSKIKPSIEIIASPYMDVEDFLFYKTEFNTLGYNLTVSKLINKNKIKYLIQKGI